LIMSSRGDETMYQFWEKSLGNKTGWLS